MILEHAPRLDGRFAKCPYKIHTLAAGTQSGMALDADPLSDPVELQDVVDAAKRLQKVPDRNWS